VFFVDSRDLEAILASIFAEVEGISPLTIGGSSVGSLSALDLLDWQPIFVTGTRGNAEQKISGETDCGNDVHSLLVVVGVWVRMALFDSCLDGDYETAVSLLERRAAGDEIIDIFERDIGGNPVKFLLSNEGYH
jgi:hypothetical protein